MTPASHKPGNRQPREWTAAETRFVSRYAGLVPLGRLALDLGRDPVDVADECARIGVDPRFVGTLLFWCDFCASWRPKLDSGGVCEVCQRRAQLFRIESQISDLLAQASPEIRATYAETEAERQGRRIGARPRPTRTPDMGAREAMAAETAYLAALSEWEAATIFRRAKAAQKRKERIRLRIAGCGATS